MFFNTKIKLIEQNFKEITKWQEMFDTKVAEMEKTIQAICECIRKDRTDITGLCQIVKKLQTKGKK